MAFRISPFKLVLSPADLRLPLFRSKFLRQIRTRLRKTSDTIYTMELKSQKQKTTYVHYTFSTIPAMEGKTLLIDGAIRNHINPTPG